MPAYDALLLISFGGPEQPDEVLPFLENVLRGRDVPRERMLEVAEHYFHFGGRSPINGQNRELIAALRDDFDQHGLTLPIYWGNRNWAPYLAGAVRQMQADGVRNALALVTSAFGSYSGCRQYREDICEARVQVGAGAPNIDKIRSFYNHPGFIDAMAQRVHQAFASVDQAATRLIFTAHSIPMSMSAGSPYLAQIREACRLVAQAIERPTWELAFQSRSGPPGQPWLEPDINDRLRQIAGEGVRSVVIAPIGFLSDHMEVVYDLDTEARATAQQLGMTLARAGTVGTHPSFMAAVRDLVVERFNATGPDPNMCAEGCCPAPARRP